MAEFLTHYKTPVMERPICFTGFFIKTTTRPDKTTCPECKRHLERLENLKHGKT